MRLRQRLTALETQGGMCAPHVVLWHTDQSFDEAMAKSQRPDGPVSRLLIELAFIDDATLTPEQLAQQAKAYAWSDNLEVV